MSLDKQIVTPIPEETIRVAKAAFPKGNSYMTLRDELGLIFTDAQFCHLFSSCGRTAKSPGFLAMLSVVQYTENLTDRQVAEAVRSRIDLKYLLGLELTDPGFDYTLMSDFRSRLLTGQEDVAKLLDTFLELFKARGLVRERGKQRTDSTHILAAVRDLNRLECVGEAMRHALNVAAKVAPDWLKAWVPLDWYPRYSSRFEQYRLPSTKSERQELAVSIGIDGAVLLAHAYSADAPEDIVGHTAIEILRQIWVQNYYWQEEQCFWREAGNLPPGALLIQSPYDPEVRYSKKRQMEWKGYKVHITETCDEDQPHFITNVITESASKPDQAITSQIHADLARKGLLPQEHYVDAGYMDAGLLADSRDQHQVDLLGPVQEDTSWQAKAGQGFDLSSFFVDWELHRVTCPNGGLNQVWSENHDAYGNDVIYVRFAAGECQVCSQRSRCTQATEGPRTLKLRSQVQYEALQLARKRQATQEFKDQYSRRAGIEGTLSQAVRTHDLRRSRYLGRDKTHLQHVFSVIAINWARFVAWINEIPLAVTRISPFASLAPG
jgi:transposase